MRTSGPSQPGDAPLETRRECAVYHGARGLANMMTGSPPKKTDPMVSLPCRWTALSAVMIPRSDTGDPLHQSSTAMRGSTKTNVAPSPSTDSNHMSPPCSLTNSRDR